MTNARDEIVTDNGSDSTSDGVLHFAAPTMLAESVATSETRPVGLRRVVNERGQRVGWGAVWSGATVAVATYVLLDLLLIAVGALDVGTTNTNGLPDGTWWSLLAGVVAFLLGGLVAGASNASRRSADGLLHGAGAWGVGAVLLLLFAIAASGMVFGGLGVAVDRLGAQQATSGTGAANNVKDAAGMAAAMLAATAIAAIIGGLIGTKLRSRDDHADTVRLHDSDGGRAFAA